MKTIVKATSQLLCAIKQAPKCNNDMGDMNIQNAAFLSIYNLLYKHNNYIKEEHSETQFWTLHVIQKYCLNQIYKHIEPSAAKPMLQN